MVPPDVTCVPAGSRPSGLTGVTFRRATEKRPDTTVQEAGVSGAISVIIGVVVTVFVAQVFETPWELIEVPLAVALASFFAGFFSLYFADGGQ